MSLPDWLANRWLVTHEPSVDEIADLPAVVDRDLADAAVPRLSSDWRSGISYNAALQLATLALAASGYRPARNSARADDSFLAPHCRRGCEVDLLDAVRRKRNQLNYERAGTTSAAEAGEMYALATELRTKVVRWLAKHHRPLCPKDLNINGA
jgi:hypothetical protein